MLNNLKQRALLLQCKVSIVDVFKHFGVNLKSAGAGNYRCKASWRGGNNPLSVAVSVENNCFVDFGDSDTSGGVVKLYTLLSGYSPEINEELIIEICQTFGFDDVVTKSLDELNLELSSKMDGAKKRKVDLEVLRTKTKSQQEKIIKTRYDKSKPLSNFSYFNLKKLPNDNLSGQLRQLTLAETVEKDGLEGRFTANQLSEFKLHKAVIVPMYDLKSKELRTLSYFHDSYIQKNILEKYEVNIPNKSLHYGIPIEGYGFVINKDDNVYNQGIKHHKEIFVTEGLATGLSVFNALKHEYSVVVSFGSTNAKAVCKQLSELYPESIIVFCADKDKPQIDKSGQVITPVGTSILSGIETMLVSDRVAVIVPKINENEDNSILLESVEHKFSLKNNSEITDFNDIDAILCEQNIILSLSAFINNHSYFKNNYINLLNNPIVCSTTPVDKTYYFLSFYVFKTEENNKLSKNLHIFNMFDKIKATVSNNILDFFINN